MKLVPTILLASAFIFASTTQVFAVSQVNGDTLASAAKAINGLEAANKKFLDALIKGDAQLAKYTPDQVKKMTRKQKNAMKQLKKLTHMLAEYFERTEALLEKVKAEHGAASE